jgi:hypothetical protein
MWDSCMSGFTRPTVLADLGKSVVSPTGFEGLWKQEFQGLIKIA